VVGIGPGGREEMTYRAVRAIETSSVIIGYKTYIELISSLIRSQRVLSFSMREEIKRCKKALEIAEEGEIVALISSGDPGIYGMAGLVMELNKSGVEIEVIPGISAVNAAASLVGAPLMQDFVVVSLSDILVPWKVIEKRLECAGEGDFVIALYNPKSKKRQEQIIKARDIIMKYRPGTTPVAIVTGAFRDNERIVITDLNNFIHEEITMDSIVIVGNKMTKVVENRMITPRGYEEKYGDSF